MRGLRFRSIIAAVVIACAGGIIVAARQQNSPTPDAMMGAALHQEEVEGNLEAAIATYLKISTDQRASRVLAATALLRLGRCYERLGHADARKTYEQLVQKYGDQTSLVTQARTRLAALGPPLTRRGVGIIQSQVWTGAGNYHSWAGLPSRDGRYLPWISAGKLMLRDLVTGNDRVLDGAPGGAAVGPGAFTPNGRQFIYGWTEERTGNFLLKAIDVTSLKVSNSRIFHKTVYNRPDIDDHFAVAHPAEVSPDGTLIAASGILKKESAVALITLASGHVTILNQFTRIGWLDIDLGNFSPDGRYLVYSVRVRAGSEDAEIRAIAVDGSSDVTLVAAPGVNTGPRFTPDGSRVVFTSNRVGERWDLWSVRVAAGKALGAPELIKPDIGNVANLGFTPEGDFYFRATTIQEDALAVGVDAATGRVTGPPRRVASGFVANTFAPTWSPDGTSLAYVANPGALGSMAAGELRFVVRALTSGLEREFRVPFHQISQARFYRWFPDGRSLLLVEWHHLAGSMRTFRRLDLTSGQLYPLGDVEASSALCAGGFTADGRALLYITRAGLMRRDFATAQVERVFPPEGRSINISPDGRHVWFLKDSFSGPGQRVVSAWVAAVAGGPARELRPPKDREFTNRGCVAWDPQNRGVFLAIVRTDVPRGAGSPEAQEIWYVPFDGGKPQNTGVDMDYVHSLFMRPDGRELGFTGGRSAAQVWSLTNLFAESRSAQKDLKR